MEHTRVPHGLDLEAVPGGGGWLWRQLLAARSRLTGAVDPSAQKNVLRAERPRLLVCISAVPMQADSMRFARCCQLPRLASSQVAACQKQLAEHSSVQHFQQADGADG